MDLPFVALLLFIFIFFIFSLLLFIYARRLTEKIVKNFPIKESLVIGVVRFCSFFCLIICLGLATFFLPRTIYGKHLLGRYYFSEYLQNASASSAVKAFRLWQQAGDKSAFEQAFAQVSQDSGIWKEFFRRSATLYLDEKSPNISIHYLENIEKKVTHPVALSVVNLELGMALISADPERALRCFRRVLELKSDPESIDKARGNLHELENLNIGQESPDFHLTTTENAIIERAHLRGKVVLLQFWSRNCPSCIREIPILKKIHGLFRPEDFVMVGISLDSHPDVIKFIRENKLPLPQVTATPETAPDLMESFNIQYIPTNYILDKNGRIAYKKLRGEALETALHNLLTR